jgi:hypothetical protein
MPLSEEEQRLLDEMERNLYGTAHDVHTSSGSPAQLSPGRIFLGFVGIALGLAILILGVSLQLLILGVAGFVLMFIGVIAALNTKGASAKPGAARASSSRGRSASGQRPGFMTRLENRWDERDSQ